MATADLPENEPVRLFATATRICVTQKQGFGDQAINVLTQAILNDPGLRNHAVRQCAYDLVRLVAREHRDEVNKMNGTEFPPQTFSTETQRKVQIATRRWFNWLMMDRTPLAIANKEKVLSDAGRYQVNARGNQVNADFLRAIAGKMGEDDKVMDVWTEIKLAKLRRKIEGQVP